MIKLYDKNKTVEITMMTWDNAANNYSPCFAADFFQVGNLYMRDDGSYKVEDVDYCIEQAEDWMYCRGDFYGTEHDMEREEPRVIVTELA